MGHIIYRQNDNLLELTGLQDQVSENYVNDATVTAHLRDADGVDVPGQNWPAAMIYIAGSDGDYSLTLVEGLDLADRADYRAEIKALTLGGVNGCWFLGLHAADRRVT